MKWDLGHRETLVPGRTLASCAPRSPGVQPAGEGVLGVSAAVVALSSAKSLSSAASNSSELSGAEISTSKIWSVSSEVAGTASGPGLASGGKRHCGVGVTGQSVFLLLHWDYSDYSDYSRYSDYSDCEFVR